MQGHNAAAALVTETEAALVLAAEEEEARLDAWSAIEDAVADMATLNDVPAPVAADALAVLFEAIGRRTAV